jgi:hypothetical protein
MLSIHKHLFNVIFFSAVFACCQLSMLVHAQTVGTQKSETGIRHSFLVTGSITAIIGEDNQVKWQVPGRSRDGFVLSNGNVLVSIAESAREYTRDGKLVFEYKLDPVNKELGTVVRLENGNTMVVERGPKPRILEITPAGKIAVNVPLQPDTNNAHMQTRMARKLPNGDYLVPHLLGFVVKQYDNQGNVKRAIKTDLAELGGRAAENWPFTAILLKSNNILVNLTHGNKTVEFDQAGKVVWRVDNSHVAGRFDDPCGAQRLDNGNTVICSYHQQAADKPRVFEITRDKQVVWEFFSPNVSLHEIHVLTTNGKSVIASSRK